MIASMEKKQFLLIHYDSEYLQCLIAIDIDRREKNKKNKNAEILRARAAAAYFAEAAKDLLYYFTRCMPIQISVPGIPLCSIIGSERKISNDIAATE